jgi:hypothetical protein
MFNRTVSIFVLLILCFSLCLGEVSTIRNTIPAPRTCVRKTFPDGSYSHWIQNLKLKAQPVIQDYRGQTVHSGLYRVWGVVDLPLLFHSDLEQCADFAMRLWAEYHKNTGKLDQLYLFDYAGNKQHFSRSGKSFNQFLHWAFVKTNSHSLKSGCRAVSAEQLIPGDMFVQNERGGIGHVSVILDICRSGQAEDLYLVGYSFMPAQEFHIEKADDAYGNEGWFTLEGYTRYLRDYLNYGTPALRRFDP